LRETRCLRLKIRHSEELMINTSDLEENGVDLWYLEAWWSTCGRGGGEAWPVPTIPAICTKIPGTGTCTAETRSSLRARPCPCGEATPRNRTQRTCTGTWPCWRPSPSRDYGCSLRRASNEVRLEVRTIRQVVSYWGNSPNRSYRMLIISQESRGSTLSLQLTQRTSTRWTASQLRTTWGANQVPTWALEDRRKNVVEANGALEQCGKVRRGHRTRGITLLTRFQCPGHTGGKRHGRRRSWTDTFQHSCLLLLK
jgi:hypothetical protein